MEGAREYLPDNSVDLIISDPPYGIAGDTLHKHYNRNESLVLDGYVEVPAEEYPAFSLAWIKEAERVLKPGGSLYIVSGYSNLIHILNALQNTSLQEVNHIIWKYNFGVYTRKKYISSHYHILYYVKPGGQPVFNTFSRYGEMEKNDESKGSLNYQDREDVWIINKEYKHGKIKNKNELPTQLLVKMIQYSSNEGDLVCDFFLGSFSTAKVAIGLNRRACGFEKSSVAFDYQIREIKKIVPGSLIPTLRTPAPRKRTRQGERISEAERERVTQRYSELKGQKMTQKAAIQQMTEEFGRGYWSLLRMLQQVSG